VEVGFIRSESGHAQIALVTVIRDTGGLALVTYLADPEWAALLRSAETPADPMDLHEDPGWTYPEALRGVPLPAESLSPFAFEGAPETWTETGGTYAYAALAAEWAARVDADGWAAARSAMLETGGDPFEQ
jgi:hypothetical protein